MKETVIGVILLALVGGGIYVATSNDSEPTTMMEKDGDAMMEKEGESMEGETMMKGDAMMEKDGMVGGDAMMEKDGDAMMQAETGMMIKSSGTFEDYSEDKIQRAENGDVVLYFSATWCPTCNALNNNLNANLNSIPEGVNILKVDYDNSTELKKKYGVTFQHTFVQVDAEGNKITKWSGGTTLESVVKNIK